MVQRNVLVVLIAASALTFNVSSLQPQQRQILPVKDLEASFDERSLCSSYATIQQHQLHDSSINRNYPGRFHFRITSTSTRSSLLHSRVNHQEELSSFEKNILNDCDSILNNWIDLAALPQGIPNDFYVVKKYVLPAWNHSVVERTLENNSSDDQQAFNSYLMSRTKGISMDDIRRLDLKPDNLTLPVALMISDPEEFPSLSRARKACRKGIVLVHRQQLPLINAIAPISFLDSPKNCFKGRVGDRIYCCTDSIGKQVRMGRGYSPLLSYAKPPFELPVVYEDDHFALVNKPAGIVVYGTGRGRVFRMSIRAALPFVLTPPSVGTYSILRRPATVHRLDKPTSGLLVVAKTKPAMVHLAQQFHDRKAKKTYMAVINGLPEERTESRISSEEAYALGVDIDSHELSMKDDSWQLIDSPLDEKQAITLWRACDHVKSLHANDGYLTLVEVKLKTGRHHQIRRHMAWHCNRPIIGDGEYDGATSDALTFRGKGLFLCSNQITLEHPFYNSVEGRAAWNKLAEDLKTFECGRLWLSSDGKVMITARIALPEKFRTLLKRSEGRYYKLAGSTS